MHSYILRRFEAEADLNASYSEHFDGYLVADLHGLTWTSAQNEHWLNLPDSIKRIA
jgi:hypothetical protein